MARGNGRVSRRKVPRLPEAEDSGGESLIISIPGLLPSWTRSFWGRSCPSVVMCGCCPVGRQRICARGQELLSAASVGATIITARLENMRESDQAVR